MYNVPRSTYLRTYPMTSGGRRGAITDLLTTSRHPFRSFDTLRDSAVRRQVQSLILSSHRFLWPPLLLPPLTVISVSFSLARSKTDRLQRLQNQCARILTKSPRREHITPVLKKNTLAKNSRYNHIYKFDASI